MFTGKDNFSERINLSTNLKQDLCAERARFKNSTDKLKYYTNMYFNEGCNPSHYDFLGSLPKDGRGIAQCAIDESNSLRKQRLTQAGFPQQLGTIPMAAPNMSRGCLIADVESSLRPLNMSERKECNPKGHNYHERSFYIFDDFCYDHASVQNTVWPGHRGGIDTRQMKLGSYNKKDRCYN